MFTKDFNSRFRKILLCCFCYSLM